MTVDDLAGLSASSFRDPPAQAAWKQVNVALVRANGDAMPSARALFRAVVPRLDHWHRDGVLHGWFFMRKPPDVRLRVCVRTDAGDAARELDRMLQAAQDRGQIGGFFWNEYSPEQGRFGGPAGMMLAHAYFHVDSTLWCRLDEFDERGLRKASADELLPTVLHHMFQYCCGSERVDEAWHKLAALVSGGPITSDLEPRELPLTLDALTTALGLHSPEGMVLRAYAAANELLREGLIGLQENLQIERPLSEIAATVAFFNLNRHGFPGERSAAMTARMIAAIDARRSKRQAITDAQGQHIQR
jgi:thiopeptide-type bacteriocin biosynthesis protein